MASIRESIEYTKKNPDSPFSKEFKRRLNSGLLSGELTREGLSAEQVRAEITPEVQMRADVGNAKALIDVRGSGQPQQEQESGIGDKVLSGVERVSDFLGIGNIGRRIGSELVRFTPEGEMLSEMESKGQVSEEQARDIRTGGVSNKQAIGSAALTALNTALPGIGASVYRGVQGARAAGGAARAASSIGSAVKTGAKVGAAGGAATGMDQDEDAVGILKQTAFGGLLGAALPVAAKAVQLAARGAKATPGVVSRTADKIGRNIENRSARRDVLQNATKAEQQVIRSGIDDTVVDFVNSATPEDKAAFRKMFDIAQDNSKNLRTKTLPKQIPGQTLLKRVNHLIERQNQIGAKLGKTVREMPTKPVNVTPQFEQFTDRLGQMGIQVRRNGTLRSTGRIPESDLGFYQKMYDAFRPGRNGQVLRTPQYIHAKRRLLFDELNIAKARQEAFSDEVQRTAEFLRSRMMEPLENINPAYRALNTQFAKTRKPLEDFVKLIGYKGRLDDITKKDLRTGEVIQRVLGNAKDRPMSVIEGIDEAARNSGYTGNENLMDEIMFSDMLENLFGTTQTRSLRGEVGRGAMDAVTETAGALGDAAGGRTMNMVERGMKMIIGEQSDEKIRAMDALLDQVYGKAIRAQSTGGGASRIPINLRDPKLQN